MGKHGYWVASALVSLVAVAIIFAIWGQTDRRHPPTFTIVHAPEDVDAFVERQVEEGQNAQFTEGAPIRLPTGFFIQSMGFTTPSSVNVKGYVWQKYPLDFPYQKGLTFPEEVSSGDTILEEHYRTTVLHDGETYELIGWYFDVTLRQPFDYSRYPLDFLTVWLRVWPEDFTNDHKMLLVPDFASYVGTGQPRFGLDQDIVTGEWTIEESFFAYRDVPYDTRFGYDLPEGAADVADVYSEFYFNLGANRTFINAFVINLVPLFVVALLLFSALMTISDDEKQSSRFGFSTSGLLGTCSALFFVVLLSHIQVRSQFAGSGLVYIEYFYLVMYVAILLVALNSYVFSLTALSGRTILHWRDNLLPKVLFWPFLLWSMVIVSWLVLY